MQTKERSWAEPRGQMRKVKCTWRSPEATAGAWRTERGASKRQHLRNDLDPRGEEDADDNSINEPSSNSDKHRKRFKEGMNISK